MSIAKGTNIDGVEMSARTASTIRRLSPTSVESAASTGYNSIRWQLSHFANHAIHQF